MESSILVETISDCLYWERSKVLARLGRDTYINWVSGV